MGDPNEYLRRNLVIAKAERARANVLYTLERMIKRDDCPQWLVYHLQNAYDKMDDVIKELVKHRTEVKLHG